MAELFLLFICISRPRLYYIEAQVKIAQVVVDVNTLNITHGLLVENDKFVTDFTLEGLQRLTPAKVNQFPPDMSPEPTGQANKNIDLNKCKTTQTVGLSTFYLIMS